MERQRDACLTQHSPCAEIIINYVSLIPIHYGRNVAYVNNIIDLMNKLAKFFARKYC